MPRNVLGSQEKLRGVISTPGKLKHSQRKSKLVWEAKGKEANGCQRRSMSCQGMLRGGKNSEDKSWEVIIWQGKSMRIKCYVFTFV